MTCQASVFSIWRDCEERLTDECSRGLSIGGGLHSFGWCLGISQTAERHQANHFLSKFTKGGEVEGKRKYVVRVQYVIEDLQDHSRQNVLQEAETDRCRRGHQQEEARGDHQRDRDRTMLNARVLYRACLPKKDQMIDHPAVEHAHQHERHCVVKAQIEKVPQWVHSVQMRIRVDRTIGLVRANEEKEMEIEDGEHSDDGGDDDEHILGLPEPGLVQPAERKVPVETDEDAHPGRDLRGEVVEKGDDLTRNDCVAEKGESVGMG